MLTVCTISSSKSSSYCPYFDSSCISGDRHVKYSASPMKAILEHIDDN